MRWLGYAFLWLVSLGFLGAIGGVVAIAFVINYYAQDLPDYSQLKNYEPPIITRIYAGDGHLMAEYAQEKRIFMPIHAIPDRLKHAFLSAEDQNFYDHKGIDGTAVARAILINLKNRGTGRRLVGASTITQQVAKNFLLTNEVSYERKIKEAILAYRMEKAMSKDKLLELYLNEIFLGQRSYGVAAAALTYFNKPLDDLTIAESAYLASLPKAPNNYHPVRNHDAALARRNWVIGRMLEDGHITPAQAELARQAPLTMATAKDEGLRISAPYFAEEIRRELEREFGGKALYEGGLAVRTTLDPHLQDIAEGVLRDGLIAYDHRHGWRGALDKLKSMNDWDVQLSAMQKPAAAPHDWRMAVVTDISGERARIGFEDKTTGYIPLEGLKWARKSLNDGYALGPEILSPRDVLEIGDVILAEKTEKDYVLRQIPRIQGALVAMDPHTGRVLAMQGGWHYNASSFNRATQAKRQPGSAFKPFVYLAALDQGFTPTTLVLDAPFVMEQSPGNYWRPTNYSGQFYGPTPIRVGVEKSRNLMTVRLADHIGMDTVVEYAARFGIADGMKPFLSYSLGANETTLLRLTNAYAMLVNGGKRITPHMIDRIQNRYGETIRKSDERPCTNCGPLLRWDGQAAPDVPDTREQVADPRTAYQMTSILEGVAQRGTAARLKALDRPLGGKTGTTNESKDTWFIGFSPDLVVGVFVGFDDPKSMGKRETGSTAALPIFQDFMQQALKETPPTPFRIPPGVKLMRVNAATGRAAMPGDQNVIWEAFVSGTEPNLDNYVLDNGLVTGGAGIDPYGNPAPYETYVPLDPSVEVYDSEVYGGAPPAAYGPVPEERPYQPELYAPPPEPAPGVNYEDPFSSFSRGHNGPAPRTEQPIQPRPVPQEPPPSTPEFSGTGGFY